MPREKESEARKGKSREKEGREGGRVGENGEGQNGERERAAGDGPPVILPLLV